MVYKIRKFTSTMNFAGAIKITLAAAIPVICFSLADMPTAGFAVAIGAMLTYPSDTSSNLRLKINGIVLAAFLVALSAYVICLAYPFPILFYPLFAAMVFGFSMISVYGQRATLVSFSGLLSISLIFSNVYTGTELLQHCALMLAGGFFYLLVSLIFYFLSPHRYAEHQMTDCIRLTGKYLKLRGDLWAADADRDAVIEKQLSLQVEINTIHENLREALIRNRPDNGMSAQNRKMLAVFISLVEILELALATSFEHAKLHQKFSGREYVLSTYQDLAYNLAATLKKIATRLENRQKYTSKHNLFEDLAALDAAIVRYENEVGKNLSADGAFILRTMYDYAARQVEKINVVERAYSSKNFRHDVKGADRELERFLTPQSYPFSVFRENLSFSSSSFRHSLRLTVTILAGFILGKLLLFQNAYWILLTIVVIMRPGYGLTKERSFQRMIGTILGGVIAFGILKVLTIPLAIGILAIVFMILGYSFTQINYKVSATFITMYVILTFGMMGPGVQNLVEYRIFDTLVGACLAYLANHFLWPSWEFLNVPTYITKAITANRNYLRQISEFYNNKGEVQVSYRLARKEAFIEVGNLMASFQRMVREPKSKQKSLFLVNRLAVLNHNLLSASASLGTYIQSHKTTSASKAFNRVVENAIQNLDDAVNVLNGTPSDVRKVGMTPVRFSEVRQIMLAEVNVESNEVSVQEKLQEAQLVSEQLVWMTSLAENIFKAVVDFTKQDQL
ncbi:MAG: FUSC family protein [Flavobacterium sp.]|nr:MAG: FUSC family protein [Flavobacterium sp.]